MNDDLAVLAAELHALIAKWGIEAARAAFEQHADALSAAQREQLAVLAFGSGNSFSGPVNVGDVAGGNVTKGNADVPGTVQGAVVGVNQGTVQVAIAAPGSRSLEDYLAALDRLATLYMAAKEAPRTLGWLAETEVFAHARAELNNEILDDLRVPIARAVLAWSLPADDTMLTLDAVRQSLVAAALLPLVRGTTLDKVYRGKDALTAMSSGCVTSLVLTEHMHYYRSRRTPDDLDRTRVRLTRALADPQCAVGCARLLTDLADPQRGLPVLAAAYQHAPATQTNQTPAALRLFATGVMIGAGGAALLAATLALLQRERRDGTAPPSVAPPGQGPRAWDGQIPVTRAAWRDELARRNEHFGAAEGYFCYVRGDTYRIGGWDKEQPAANIALRPFWVARVPVTVSQYARFIAEGGYRTRRWWTPNGWEWRAKSQRTKP